MPLRTLYGFEGGKVVEDVNRERNGEIHSPLNESAALSENVAEDTARPDPEVRERAQRRRFTAEYKHRIIREADAAQAFGEIGALLRREGLYWSHLVSWRKLDRDGALKALKAKRRGPQSKKRSPEALKLQELEKKLARVSHELEVANTIIEVQKKLSRLLGIPPKDTESGGNGP